MFDAFDFDFVFVGVERAAHHAKAHVHQVGIGGIGFAIVADVFQTACMISVPNLAAVHAQFAGKAAEFGHIVQRHAGTRLVEGEQIHQVAMAGVVAADVVVPLKVAAVAKVAVAHVPVAGGADAVYQGAVVEDGQVETAAIPADELRRIVFDDLEEFGNHDFFAVFGIADGADADFVLTPAHTAGDGDDLVQMVLHKVAAGFGAALLLGKQGDFVVGQIGRQIVKQADAVYVGNGFDVEGEYRGHGVIGLDKE